MELRWWHGQKDDFSSVVEEQPWSTGAAGVRESAACGVAGSAETCSVIKSESRVFLKRIGNKRGYTGLNANVTAERRVFSKLHLKASIGCPWYTLRALLMPEYIHLLCDHCGDFLTHKIVAGIWLQSQVAQVAWSGNQSSGDSTASSRIR